MTATRRRSRFAPKLTAAIVLLGACLSLAPTSITISGVANVNGDGTTGDNVTGNIAAGDFAGAASQITAPGMLSVLGTADLSLAATNTIYVNQALAYISPTTRVLALSAGDTINVNAALSGSLLDVILNPVGDRATISAAINTRTLTINGLTALNTSSITTTGDQTYDDAVTLGANTTVMSTDGGEIRFDGRIDSASGHTYALVVNTAGTTTLGDRVGDMMPLQSLNIAGATAIDGGSVTTIGAQTYGDPVTLGTDTTVMSTGGDAIRFNGRVNGNYSLDVYTVDTTIFGGRVGDMMPLQSLNIAGATAFNGGSVTTVGAQTYGDAVTLGADTDLTSMGSGAIRFTGRVNGNYSLVVYTVDTTIFDGAVGATNALWSLYTAGTTAINGGTVTTVGAQTYGGAVTLGADTTVTGTTVTFETTLNADATPNDRALVVNASATTFGGQVGNAGTLLSLTTDAAGTTAINGGAVTTTLAQTYHDAITLGANTTLTSTANGNVSMGAVTGGGNDLTITNGSGDISGSSISGANTAKFINTGGVTFSGSISAATIDITAKTGGSANFQGSVTATNFTTAGQAYNVALTGPTTAIAGGVNFLNTGTLTLGDGGDVLTFGGGLATKGNATNPSSVSVNGTVRSAGQPISLGAITVAGNSTIDSANNGGSAAGATVDLGAITATTNNVTLSSGAGALTLAAVSGAGLTVTNSGALNLNGTISLTGAFTQTNAATGAATLGAAVNVGSAALKGTDLALNAYNLNAGAGAVSLTFSGNVTTTTGSIVAGTLTLGGAADVGTGGTPIPTSAAALVLGKTAGSTFVSTAGGVSLEGTTGSGSLSVGASGVITQGSTALTVGGTTTLNTGANAITLTNAANDFGGEVTLTGGTTQIRDLNQLTVGASTLSGGLTLTASNTTVTGALGATSVVINGPATLSGATLTTTGAQNYNGALSLGTNVALTGGSMVFGGSVTGNNHSLAIDSASSVAFVSASELSSLTKSGIGTMTLSGQSTYTGSTIVDAGVIALSLDNALFGTSPLTLGGGTLALGGHTQALGTLTLDANSTIDFATGASVLSFANSSAVTWTGLLTITNFTTGTDSLHFGSDNTGLTALQLSSFRFADYGFATALIDSNGLVTPSAVPEPSTYAALLSAAALGFALMRRRKGMNRQNR